MPPLPEPADRLILEESPIHPGASHTVLVLDSPELAAHTLSTGARTLAFCDSASEHHRLVEGVERVTPDEELHALDLVWGRLPRDLDALDQLCSWIAPTGAALALGGRTKHMSPTMNSVLARHFATVEASLGREKSRVLRALHPRTGGNRPWPRRREIDLPTAGGGASPLGIVHHGATFASGRLDPATALLMDRFDTMINSEPGQVLDWGSGAGIIASTLSRALPDASVVAADLSWAGWAATRDTVASNTLTVDAHWDDANHVLRERHWDLVVSNPPFHAGAAKDSSATLTMIDLAAEHLLPGGELWLTFNSHLPWLSRMRRHGHAEVAAQNRGYTVARLRPGRGRGG